MQAAFDRMDALTEGMPPMRSEQLCLTCTTTQTACSVYVAKRFASSPTRTELRPDDTPATTSPCRLSEKVVSAEPAELQLGTRRGPGPEIVDLADACSRGPRGARPDWKRLRAFLDLLAGRLEKKGPATLRMPAPSGSAVSDTLLAGSAGEGSATAQAFPAVVGAARPRDVEVRARRAAVATRHRALHRRSRRATHRLPATSHAVADREKPIELFAPV